MSNWLKVSRGTPRVDLNEMVQYFGLHIVQQNTSSTAFSRLSSRNPQQIPHPRASFPETLPDTFDPAEHKFNRFLAVVGRSGWVQRHSTTTIDPLRSDTAGSRGSEAPSIHSPLRTPIFLPFRRHVIRRLFFLRFPETRQTIIPTAEKYSAFCPTTIPDMGKNDRPPPAGDWPAKQLPALLLPFPDGLDDFFRAETDTSDDFKAAFQRAAAFTALLGETRAAFLWQQALKIGFRAGSGGATESVRVREASEDYALGRELGLKEGRTGGLRDGKQEGRKAGKLQGLKEGETVGFEKGKKEGMSEGKRLGFVAGREFGEKLSKPLIPNRVLVDVGTDLLVFESVIHPPSPIDVDAVFTPTNAAAPDEPSSPDVMPLLGWGNDFTPPVAPTLLPTEPSSPEIAPLLGWGDDIIPLPPFREVHESHAPPQLPALSTLPSRDLSALRSDVGPPPFSTLQYRAHRRHKSNRPPRTTAWHSTSSRRRPTPTWPTFHPAPSRPSCSAALDWEHDPRLSDLSRVLRSMGWAREGRGDVCSGEIGLGAEALTIPQDPEALRRHPSILLNKKSKDEITVYTADALENKPGVRLTLGGILLVALLKGGDYDTEDNTLEATGQVRTLPPNFLLQKSAGSGIEGTLATQCSTAGGKTRTSWDERTNSRREDWGNPPLSANLFAPVNEEGFKVFHSHGLSRGEKRIPVANLGKTVRNADTAPGQSDLKN
ncbi:hypothetical protein C8R46DRAFT_1283930 [Mycena filopes]|nr:hypothetical protein C8R46DRAFT_1283930 [Mycena filopes]